MGKSNYRSQFAVFVAQNAQSRLLGDGKFAASPRVDTQRVRWEPLHVDAQKKRVNNAGTADLTVETRNRDAQF